MCSSETHRSERNIVDVMDGGPGEESGGEG
jgi:hypothetical protein